MESVVQCYRYKKLYIEGRIFMPLWPIFLSILRVVVCDELLSNTFYSGVVNVVEGSEILLIR